MRRDLPGRLRPPGEPRRSVSRAERSFANRRRPAAPVGDAMNAVDVSLVIPAYNEEARLGPTLERCARYLCGSPWRFEIVVVDDGSTDGTVALCRRMAAQIPALRVVETRPNRGKG